ncbi:MAG: sugar phosphate isomerase/epimerase [Armatimonadetes bacterium]|jgi:sugar phosphate isomerase/epimerase|nr:sugar phosphate isomerase/epimerase [Armatimonadota bacterium]MDI9601570.1 sugar phosphate isomerase/epimerase [Acidobacteriota bacterium]NLN90359.1 sugar phosphate isomerase/epimerase [candidate division WS1 bacterium]
MKVGVFTVLFADQSLEDTLKYVKSLGCGMVEIGTGNFPGQPHCPVDELLASDTAAAEYKAKIEDAGLEISALSCHGNALHPNESIAQASRDAWRKTLRLAEKLGVPRVVDFSGCPGGPGGGTDPIWVTAPWPDDFQKTLDWQWNEKVIPYWQAEVKEAANHGVNQIAFEMHPNFVVYNPETLLKLRAAAGDAIGANFDPSHLFWQMIDPIAAVRALKDCIWHVHAKDTKICPYNAPINGTLDTKPYTDEINRGWIFRTVGYGHDLAWWKEFVSNLRLIGYDLVLSIEHEDSLMSPKEGFEKAVELLLEATIVEPAGEAYWA